MNQLEKAEFRMRFEFRTQKRRAKNSDNVIATMAQQQWQIMKWFCYVFGRRVGILKCDYVINGRLMDD